MAFSGDFTPILAKHSKSFSLIDCVSVGVDRRSDEEEVRGPGVGAETIAPVICRLGNTFSTTSWATWKVDVVSLDVRNKGLESARTHRAVNVPYASIPYALTRAFSIPATNASVRAKVWASS
jgi:hypothetical protein